MPPTHPWHHVYQNHMVVIYRIGQHGLHNWGQGYNTGDVSIDASVASQLPQDPTAFDLPTQNLCKKAM